jgi:hypothetical protein
MANKSDHPLNLAPSANVQHHYTLKLHDTNVQTNDGLLRWTLPVPAEDSTCHPQNLRAISPVNTGPDRGHGDSKGKGGPNLFDRVSLKTDGGQLGVGPQLAPPMAAQHGLGADKWQASSAAVDTCPTGLRDALIQYQCSIAGDRDRQHVRTICSPGSMSPSVNKVIGIHGLLGVTAFSVLTDLAGYAIDADAQFFDIQFAQARNWDYELSMEALVFDFHESRKRGSGLSHESGANS